MTMSDHPTLRDAIAAALRPWLQKLADTDRATDALAAAVQPHMDALTAERDAYADTLAGIAEAGTDEDGGKDLAAALVAKLTLDQRGYLPWGRLHTSEAERDEARAALARAACGCDNDPIECNHEAAAGHWQEQARQAEAALAAANAREQAVRELCDQWEAYGFIPAADIAALRRAISTVPTEESL